MHLAFDIFQGIGIAAALGIRPFLPALAAGALAAGGVEIHFDGTHYAFLQRAPFLGAMAAATIVLALVERRVKPDHRAVVALVALIGAGLGALMFAGSLARGRYTAWPGLVGGVVCALIAAAATVPLIARVRRRLDQAAVRALPVFVEGLAVLLSALSVLAPPVGVIGLALLVWLLVGGRRREGKKYAGLRILK